MPPRRFLGGVSLGKNTPSHLWPEVSRSANSKIHAFGGPGCHRLLPLSAVKVWLENLKSYGFLRERWRGVGYMSIFQLVTIVVEDLYQLNLRMWSCTFPREENALFLKKIWRIPFDHGTYHQNSWVNPTFLGSLNCRLFFHSELPTAKNTFSIVIWVGFSQQWPSWWLTCDGWAREMSVY